MPSFCHCKFRINFCSVAVISLQVVGGWVSLSIWEGRFFFTHPVNTPTLGYLRVRWNLKADINHPLSESKRKTRHQYLPWKTPKLETSLLDSAKDRVKPAVSSRWFSVWFFKKNHWFSLGSIHSLTFPSRILREHVATKLQTNVVNWRGWQNDVLPSGFNLEPIPVSFNGITGLMFPTKEWYSVFHGLSICCCTWTLAEVDWFHETNGWHWNLHGSTFAGKGKAQCRRSFHLVASELQWCRVEF